MWGLTLWLALVSCAILVAKPTLHRDKKAVSLVLHLLTMVPFFALSSRFLVNDTSILHVAAYGGAALPMKYKFAATWAAREGPLLLWVVWMSLLAWIWREPLKGEESHMSKGSMSQKANEERGSSTSPWLLRLRTVHGFSLLLLLVSIGLDPFKINEHGWMGRGLNELLQTDLMVIHPPLVFLGYAFCIHLAAISISSIFGHTYEGIGERMTTLARPGLFFTTLGVGLGGLWAYLILDWGGYWAWDPVETGSFLPWLALVILLHLRLKPGKTSDTAWLGVGLACGALALFATLVTRAGGVWASSVHTFVNSSDGAPPEDIFNRILILREDDAGVEIMTYVLLILMLCGLWIMLQRRKVRDTEVCPRGFDFFALPVIFAILALFVGHDFFSYIPWFVIPLFAFIHLANDFAGDKDGDDKQATGWQFPRPVPVLFILAIIIAYLANDILLAVIFALFFAPIYYSGNARSEWAFASAGVMFSLTAAWTELLELPVAAFALVVFILPWLLDSEEDETSALKGILSKKSVQQKMALHGAVLLIGLYLVLTLAILVASIDRVNFEAHELYGSVFYLAILTGLFVYLSRNQSPKYVSTFVLSIVSLSFLMAYFFPNSLGGDSDSQVSAFITRGSLAWLSLPMALLCVLPLVFEVANQATKSSSTPFYKRIPVGAHIVHLGLVLLIIGHIFTTVLVDRGETEHRISMVKGEMVYHDDLAFKFVDIHLIGDEELEVGDGLSLIEIEVYERSSSGEHDWDTWEYIGTVTPGTLRFDATGTARSEVDTLSRLSGDVVFIFDLTQATAMMRQVATEGSESIELVRVTVYDLPNSHLVWLGFGLMLIGMAMTSFSDFSKNGTRNGSIPEISEEE